VCKDFLRDRALDNIDHLLNTVGTEVETSETKQIVGQFGIYALYRAMTARFVPDKRVFERLWKVQERIPLVVLYTKYVWTVDTFLLEFGPMPGMDYRKLVPRDPRVLQEQAASELIEGLPGFVSALYGRVCAWSLSASAAFARAPLAATHPTGAAELLRARAVLLSQAVCLAHMTSRHLHLFLNYHLHFGRGSY
jgi:hypothetical protein